MSSTVLQTFSGALQASLSVLLVILYGVIAAQFNLLDNASAKKASHLSVKLFLPFLLITKLGKELSLEEAPKYVPILSKYIPLLIWHLYYPSYPSSLLLQACYIVQANVLFNRKSGQYSTIYCLWPLAF